MIEGGRLAEDAVRAAAADPVVAALGVATTPDDLLGLTPDTWSEGLAVLVDALNVEARLTEIGEAVLTDQIVKPLRNRFAVAAWLAAHPETAETPVERPVVVVGLPRTGTTLLSNLLDGDPANRSLGRWECFAAVPPPAADPDANDTDARMVAARIEMDALYSISPEFKAIHFESAEGPTECITVLAGDLRSIHYETLANIPSYGAWVEQCDHRSAYAHHRRVLQVLQSAKSGRWTLKSPCHLLTLDALVDTYPDATLVATHRDPARVVVSLAHLVSVLSGLATDGDFRAYVGQRWFHVVGQMIDRELEFRGRTGDQRWIDLPYPGLVADPVAAVGRLYGRLGWAFDDTDGEEGRGDGGDGARSAAAVGRAARDNARHRFGRHTYRPADFGLDPRQLEERFVAYRERFDIEAEPFD